MLPSVLLSKGRNTNSIRPLGVHPLVHILREFEFEFVFVGLLFKDV